MSNFSLMKRGVIQISDGDVSPLTIPLSAAVRSVTAKLTYGFKDRRRNENVIAGQQAITDASVSPIDITIAAVDVAASKVEIHVLEDRTGTKRGAIGYLTSATNLRLEFAVDAGDTAKISYQVIESKPARGV